MLIISDVPDRVARLINAHLEALLLWFSEYVYTQILKRADNHLLVKVHDHLDFAPLEKACVGYHHTSGPGAPPTHGVPRLVRALVVKYLHDCSLRQLEYQIRYNLIVKWFVGYPIFADGPDHSTLDRFALWVCEHEHRTFFDEVLRQINADFPEDREQPQIGDTFAMQADAAPESLVGLIRHACD